MTSIQCDAKVLTNLQKQCFVWEFDLKVCFLDTFDIGDVLNNCLVIVSRSAAFPDLLAFGPKSRRILHLRPAKDSAEHAGHYGASSFGPRPLLRRFAKSAGHKKHLKHTKTANML